MSFLKNIHLYKSVESKRQDLLFVLIVFAIYAIIISVGVWNHESWRDEAKAWLIARDLTPSQILYQTGYEGHPVLWYYLLKILIFFNLPYFSMSILNAGIALIAAFVFLMYSPFSRLFKVLILFSYYLVFEYSIIARNYQIAILLIWLLAAIFEYRYKFRILYAILLLLLLQTNVLVFGLCAGLIVMFAFENKHRIKEVMVSMLLMIFGAAFLFWQMYSPKDNIFYGYFNYLNLLVPARACLNALIPVSYEYQNLFLIFVGFGIMMILVFPLLKIKYLIFLLFSSFGWLFYVIIFKYYGFHRHHALLFIFLTFLYWIYQKQDKHSWNIKLPNKLNSYFQEKYIIPLCKGLSLLVLLISCFWGFRSLYMEVRYPFSGSKDMAEFIKKNVPANSKIVTYQAHMCEAVFAYCPEMQFIDLINNKKSSFTVWNSSFIQNRKKTDSLWSQKIDSIYENSDNIYYLSSDSIIFKKEHNIRLLYYAPYKNFWINSESSFEEFWLYKFSKMDKNYCN